MREQIARLAFWYVGAVKLLLKERDAHCGEDDQRNNESEQDREGGERSDETGRQAYPEATAQRIQTGKNRSGSLSTLFPVDLPRPSMEGTQA